jgi:predicted membrane channel-forming protein YqfA (hemolysin III family)
MKHLLNFLAISLLIASFLYPLFYWGTGRPVVWWLVILMVLAGIGCIWLLVRFHKEL